MPVLRSMRSLRKFLRTECPSYRRTPIRRCVSKNRYSSFSSHLSLSGPSYLCYCVFNHLLIRHIRFVANKQLVNTFSGISVNFLQPLFYVVEWVHVGDIVNNADSMCTAIIRRRNCPEALLTGSVPLDTLSASEKKQPQDCANNSQFEASPFYHLVLWSGFSGLC